MTNRLGLVGLLGAGLSSGCVPEYRAVPQMGSVMVTDETITDCASLFLLDDAGLCDTFIDDSTAKGLCLNNYAAAQDEALGLLELADTAEGSLVGSLEGEGSFSSSLGYSADQEALVSLDQAETVDTIERFFTVFQNSSDSPFFSCSYIKAAGGNACEDAVYLVSAFAGNEFDSELPFGEQGNVRIDLTRPLNYVVEEGCYSVFDEAMLNVSPSVGEAFIGATEGNLDNAYLLDAEARTISAVDFIFAADVTYD